MVVAKPANSTTGTLEPVYEQNTIDFGTTNSVIAAVGADGRPRVLDTRANG